MLGQILSFLIASVAGLLTLAFLARFWLQWTRASFRNPVGEAVITVTNWAVMPLRRIVPGLLGIDWASVLAAWLTQGIHLFVIGALAGFEVFAFTSLPAIAWAAVLGMLELFIYLLMGIVIIAALLSWIAPHAPAAPLFDGLAAPLLSPVRRFIPIVGGLDFAPLIVVLLLQVMLIVLENLR